MDKQILEVTYTLHDIEQAAKQFLEAVPSYSLFAFSGEMGAGKTTFIHKLCDLLHVQDAVSSPTFALINEYHYTDSEGTDKTIYHLDWFRLRDGEEAFNAGMDECVEQAQAGAAICFIEWPEKAMELLRPPYLWIHIETISITERKMTVTLMELGIGN